MEQLAEHAVEAGLDKPRAVAAATLVTATARGLLDWVAATDPERFDSAFELFVEVLAPLVELWPVMSRVR